MGISEILPNINTSARRIALLALVLCGIVACDDSPPEKPASKSTPLQGLPNKPSILPTTGKSTGSNESQATVISENFPEEKQQKIANLLAQHHYKKPNVSDNLKQTGSSLQLNQYLTSLDAYSKYMSPEENRFFQERAKLTRIDIGINLLVHKEEVLAVPLLGSPAYKLGLTLPSQLLSLNERNISFADFSSYRFLGSLMPGNIVLTEIKAPNSRKPISYAIPAQRYTRELVEYTERGNLGVITIHEFRETTTQQMRTFLPMAMHQDGLVIDLRYCPGGDLFTTIDMLSLFLPPEQNAAFLTTDGQEKPVALQSLPGKIFHGKPIYLLISKYTASSSEIFIHAIKKYINASYIIGEATTGKCLAIEKYELKDGSALQLSAYEILTPDRQSCNGIPILPDIRIPNIELRELDAIIQVLPRTLR